MKETALTRTYIHYPRLVLDEKSSVILGGLLQSLSFETFEQLDSDWARQSYFEETRPTVWVKQERAHARPFTHDDAAVQTGMLIFNALLAVTGRLYPDPRLSVVYRTPAPGHTSRLIGPYERTFFLNRRGFDPIGAEQLGSLAAIVESWHSYGFQYSHRVFSPLRGLASLASSAMVPAVGMIPLIVSLEGFLIPDRVQGIARTMARIAKHLLGKATPSDIDEFMRKVYKLRSRVIHGDGIPSEEARAICEELQRLTGALVVAAAQEIVTRKLPPQSLDELRVTWIRI